MTEFKVLVEAHVELPNLKLKLVRSDRFDLNSPASRAEMGKFCNTALRNGLFVISRAVTS